MNFDFEGKTVLVTGSSRGIGRTTAIMFAEAGARVIVHYRQHSDDAAKTIKMLSGKGHFMLGAELESTDDIRRLAETAISKAGRIDILVNNAGIWTYGKIGSMSEKIWKETIQVNLNGMFYMTNAVVPYMKKQKSGKIINISSTAGQRGEAEHSHYAASKGGMISFTKAISTELGPYNINVNSVAPGWVDTDLNDSIFSNKKYKEQERKKIPIQRIPTPEDIAGPILFLASDLARHITGEIMNVNGGSVLVG
jgi:3-oxoacyl-[acyl-carrier protein] reductase